MTKKHVGERDWIVARTQDVAEWMGITNSAVLQWRADGMPGRPHRWDLREITQWRLNRLSTMRRYKPEDDPDRKTKLIKAQIMERRYEREEGGWITFDDHEAQIVELLNAVREGLLSLGPTLAAQVGGITDERERFGLIEDHLCAFLRGLSDRGGVETAEFDAKLEAEAERAEAELEVEAEGAGTLDEAGGTGPFPGVSNGKAPQDCAEGEARGQRPPERGGARRPRGAPPGRVPLNLRGRRCGRRPGEKGE